MEVLSFVDRFTALGFAAIGAPPAARSIQILPLNDGRCWELSEVILWIA
jgi:hypothetical protein